MNPLARENEPRNSENLGDGVKKMGKWLLVPAILLGAAAAATGVAAMAHGGGSGPLSRDMNFPAGTEGAEQRLRDFGQWSHTLWTQHLNPAQWFSRPPTGATPPPAGR